MTVSRRFGPWIWCLAVLVVNVGVAADIARSAEGFDGWTRAVYVLLPAWFVALGALVATRVRGNPVGWILMMIGTGLAVEGVASQRIGLRPPSDPTAWDVAAVIWLNSGFFFALVIPLILLAYLFPTGRFPTRRWAWAGWTAGALSVLVVVSEAFTTRVGPDDGSGNTAWSIANPIGVFEHDGLEDAGLVATVFGVGLITLIVGSVPAIVVRYRRASPDERAQLQWVGFALGLLVSATMVRLLLDRESAISGVAFALSIASIPLSITIAITRYRLYEIDRLISRALTYAAVLSLLGAVYVGVVALVTSLVPAQGSVAVAASTLAVAALFKPLRVRVRRMVDRRFFRSAYQAESLASRMGEHLGRFVSIEAIVATWTETVTDALRPQFVSVWLRERQPTPDPLRGDN